MSNNVNMCMRNKSPRSEQVLGKKEVEPGRSRMEALQKERERLVAMEVNMTPALDLLCPCRMNNLSEQLGTDCGLSLPYLSIWKL